MSNQPPPGAIERPRTATRLRFVAPPGMSLEGSQEETSTIGRYEILERLGKGAMGMVYKARDPLLDRIVAVKTIVSPRGSGKRVRRAYLERFEREAKAAAKMQHPAIVTIFDVGTDGGAPFMVLEYLPGESLADRLDRVRMPLAKGVQIAIDLASALGFAHQQRIVHRDVKPANVLNAGDNRWKLADFGIARMPDSDLTQVGIFMGTPGYAPPEAISQGLYTPQADVFAWGAVFYELISGRIPYEGPDTRTTNGYVLKETARNPREFDPSIPELLAEVCMTALHPSVEVRYKNGQQAESALRSAWERCINENVVTAKAFSNDEILHADAPKLMHGQANTATATIPDLTQTQEADRLVISSESVGEDDPTKIMQRAAAPSAAARGAGPREGQPFDTTDDIIAKAVATANRARNEAPEIAARAKAAVAGQRDRTGALTDTDTDSARAGLWIAVLIAALIVGGLGVYLLVNKL